MDALALLAQLRAEVAERRTTAERAAAIVKEKTAAFEASIAEELKAAKAAKDALAVSETAARVQLLAVYEATQEKKPLEGFEVKVGKVLEYDATKAFAWAKASGVCLIPEQLDVDAFTALAKAAPQTFDFVTVRDEPKAQLAKDLSAFVPVPVVEPAPQPAAADDPSAVEVPF